MNRVEVSDPEHLRALSRSALLELLALGFAYPTEKRLQAVEELLIDLSALHSEWEGLTEAATFTLSALRESTGEQLQSAYNGLFSGAPQCSPYEASFRAGDGASPQVTADVAGFYRAFGLGAKVGAERPDHIASELEFLALLLRRRVYAEAQGMEEAASMARAAESSFVGEHLGLWLGDFCRLVQEQSKSRFYSGMAAIARFALGQPCRSDTLGVSDPSGRR